MPKVFLWPTTQNFTILVQILAKNGSSLLILIDLIILFFDFEAFFASGGPFGAFFRALFKGYNLPKVSKWSWVLNDTIPDDHKPKKVNSYNECPLLAMWVPQKLVFCFFGGVL